MVIEVGNHLGILLSVFLVCYCVLRYLMIRSLENRDWMQLETERAILQREKTPDSSVFPDATQTGRAPQLVEQPPQPSPPPQTKYPG